MGKVVSVVVCCTLIVTIVIIAVVRDKALEKDFRVAIGRIYEIRGYYNSGDVFFKFTFEVNRKKYRGSTAFDCSTSNISSLRGLLLNDSMQVVYQKSAPKNCVILLNTEYYKKYKLKPPDRYLLLMKRIDSICLSD